MKAIAMVRLETQHRHPNTFEHLRMYRPGKDRAQRRAQQEQRAMREQHEDRGPARHQRFAATLPEFVRRQPSIGCDDAGRDQHARVDRFGDDRHAANQKPERGSREQAKWIRIAAVEHTRTGPCHREGGKKNRIGEVDRDEIGDRAIHTEQHNRSRAQKMRTAPPGDGHDPGILHPGEQQQQAEHGLDIDRHQEQGIDIETHRNPTKAMRCSNRAWFARRANLRVMAGKNR